METSSNTETARSGNLASALHAPFWDELQGAKNVFIAGCGGGYDFFSGLPIYFALKKAGLNVYLGNLTFTSLENITGEKVTPFCIEVTSRSRRSSKGWGPEQEHYWPEYFVSKWFLEKEKCEVPVYTFERTGVKNLREAYEKLVEKLDLDTIILADGGTDSLMTGNESGLGTPTEDMMSIASVNGIKNPKVQRKFLICLGMGVDSFHGVCHSHFLENTAVLSKKGAFLGAFSLLPQMEEAQKFKEAYLASQPGNSIVSSSVLSAVEGEFGNYQSPYTINRTLSSELYISPLMSLFWTYQLKDVANSVLYLDRLENTKSMGEISAQIKEYCHGVKKRATKVIPY